MKEQDKARPVSGEIMAGGSTAASARRDTADFTDAEYETVEVERPAPAAPAADPRPVVGAGMDFLRAGARAIDGSSKRGGPMFWTFALVLVALTFWVSGGHALVRHNLSAFQAGETQAPLRIAAVESRIEQHNGRGVLFVDGRAENHGNGALALPPIEISVVANDGASTRYFLGTSGTELAPGGRYSFSSRLEAPGNGVKSVSVTFREGSR